MYTRDKRRETQTGGIEEERKRERERWKKKKKSPGKDRGRRGSIYKGPEEAIFQAVGKKDRNKKVHEEPKLP